MPVILCEMESSVVSFENPAIILPIWIVMVQISIFKVYEKP